METEWSCRGSPLAEVGGAAHWGKDCVFRGVCVCVWFFQVGRRAEAGGGWVRETCWEGGSPGGEAVTPPFRPAALGGVPRERGQCHYDVFGREEELWGSSRWLASISSGM